MNKYGAKPVYFSYKLNRQLVPREIEIYKNNCIQSPELAKLGNIIRFDSQLEFIVFQILSSSPLISGVISHHPIEILPSNKFRCYPNGKKWKVDFLAKGHHKEVLMIVETKGLINKDFPWILLALEKEQPELFKKLWLVFDHHIPSNNLIKNLQNTVDAYPKIVTVPQLRELIT